MTLRNVPRDQDILDQFFSLTTKPGLEHIAWLFGMIAVYGKTPDELKHFTWNDDHTINLEYKKRPVRPLHPQWVFLFQLKEKQPSKTKSCWDALSKTLFQLQDTGLVPHIDEVLLAHRVRKVYYTPAKQLRSVGSKKKRLQPLCAV